MPTPQEEACQKGREIHAKLMAAYNALQAGTPSSDRPDTRAIFDGHYSVERKLDSPPANQTTRLKNLGLPIGNQWQSFTTSSVGPGTTTPAYVNLFINDASGMAIISKWNYSDKDKNPVKSKLPMSEILWHELNDTSTQGLPNLRVHARESIQGEVTMGIINAALKDFGKKLGEIYQGVDVRAPGPGVSEAEEKCFYTLLGTDNAKTSPRMLTDHMRAFNLKISKIFASNATLYVYFTR